MRIKLLYFKFLYKFRFITFQQYFIKVAILEGWLEAKERGVFKLKQ